MKNINIGPLIKEQFEKKVKRDKYFNKAVFARQIYVHRSTIYLIFEQKSIDIDLLIRISEALDYDFIREVYLKDKNGESKEEENRVVIRVEITKQQIGRLELPNTGYMLLKVNKE